MSNFVVARTAALLRLAAVCGAVLALDFPSASALAQGSKQKQRKPVILVPPFENQSKHHETIGYEVGTGDKANQPKRRYSVDRLTEAPRSIFENLLGNIDGITIVERQRVDTLLVESEFGALSGLVDSEKAVKLGKMLGANLIVMGTITDIRDEIRRFEGYGIKNENMNVICQIRVRLLDIESGKVQFSKIVKGSKTYTKSSFGGTASSDRNFAAIEAALEQLEGDSQFKAALFGEKPATSGQPAAEGLVEVEFAPKPENCDIEIDGKYVGGSPLKRRMAAGKEFKVRISKGGFQDWRGTIVPEAGLRITRELNANR
jgi:curli biogenesis system outer membrane secretion channel CsgG